MPPKANKPAAPKKPTKPSAKSKTGNTACSQAASNWQLSIRGKEPLDPQTYATLAKCRAMTRTAKQADDRARMGYNLNDQGAAALKGRLQKRFDQGLITQKSRDERLKMLLQQRKEKQAAVAAKPADKAASLVSSVRQKPGYGVARASAAGNRELVGLKMRNKGQVTTQPAFTLKQSSSQGGTGAGRSMGVLFQTEGTALDKAAQAGQKAPLAGQTGLFGSENQTGKPPKYVLEAGFTTWKQVNKFGLNNIVKDAPSIAKAAVDPTRNKYAGGSRDWIENDIASRIVKMTRIHGNKQLAIKAVAREYELQSQRQQEAGMPEVYKSISSELYKSSDLYNYKLNSQSQPPKPFSRQGQLAPGRGTEQRSEIAKQKWEDRPRRFLMGQTYLTKSGEPMLIHSKRQGYLTAFPYENGKPVVHSGSAIKFAYTDMAKKIAPDFRTDITNTPANLKETNNTTQSPKPFSRGGQLANKTEAPKNIEKIVTNQQLPSSMLRGGQNKRGYVAKIKGPDHKYKLEREFVKPVSSSPGGATYNIKDRGIYETQDYQRSNAYKSERTYELVGRNKTRPLFDTVPGADKLNRVSVDRIARLLKLFGKK